MKIVVRPVIDSVCVCRNCKKEFIIKKERLLENYLQCTFCGSLKWDFKDEIVEKLNKKANNNVIN